MGSFCNSVGNIPFGSDEKEIKYSSVAQKHGLINIIFMNQRISIDVLPILQDVYGSQVLRILIGSVSNYFLLIFMKSIGKYHYFYDIKLWFTTMRAWTFQYRNLLSSRTQAQLVNYCRMRSWFAKIKKLWNKKLCDHSVKELVSHINLGSCRKKSKLIKLVPA